MSLLDPHHGEEMCGEREPWRMHLQKVRRSRHEEQKPWPGQTYVKRRQDRLVPPVMEGSKLLLQNILGLLGKFIYNLAWTPVVLLIYCKPSLEIWKGCFWKWLFLSLMVDRNPSLGEGQKWRCHSIFILKPEQRNYTS